MSTEKPEKKWEHYYAAIDLKSFYASAECVDRSLDPLTTNLVVADESRTEKTICLAVSPSLKTVGIPGRPRLFEVIQKVNEVNRNRLRDAIREGKAIRDENGKYRFASFSYDANMLSEDKSIGLTYITAPPRMARYIEISANIYSIYLKYISPDDVMAYSCDEVFIDLTPYLQTYIMTARELTMTMIREVLYATGITATAGIGSNLYLAKIAMDIVAKKMPPDKDGVRLAELDVIDFRCLLWDHKPLKDFWRIGSGTARKREKQFITTMAERAMHSLYETEWFYKTFGIDAEILIDQAWGYEPTQMKDIKSYKSSANSYSEGQVLSEATPYDTAQIIVREMADSMVMRLAENKKVTDSISLALIYDRESLTAPDKSKYSGEIVKDYYGRDVPKPSHGSFRFKVPTNLGSKFIPAVMDLFGKIADRELLFRKIYLSVGNCLPDNGCYQLDLFSNIEDDEREKRLQAAMISIKGRFGKNAVMRGTSYQSGATMIARNGMIGGHKAENDTWEDSADE